MIRQFEEFTSRRASAKVQVTYYFSIFRINLRELDIVETLVIDSDHTIENEFPLTLFVQIKHAMGMIPSITNLRRVRLLEMH